MCGALWVSMCSAGLWITVGCLTAPVIALCSFLAWIFITVNRHPPRMFSQQFVGENRLTGSELNRAISEILKQNFPSGTTLRDLKSSLYKEGLRDRAPPPPNCIPPEKEAEVPLRTVYTLCYDNKTQMEYSWSISLFVCSGYINVQWTTDGDGRVDRIKGSGHTACL